MERLITITLILILLTVGIIGANAMSMDTRANLVKIMNK